ncbi:MAG: hypothetical protein KJ666_12125, partial [Bacteroidetes bacterium]|nr:hypothetical protein [Bacteroidota bacterium]
MDFFNSWFPFLYLYGAGGVFFGFGLYILIKSKALNLKNKIHKRWMRYLVFGFFYLMAIHLLLILL